MSAITPDKKDERDLQYHVAKKLPERVTLHHWVREIEDQKKTLSCTANAVASAIELSLQKQKINMNLSRTFLYWFGRVVHGKKGKAVGLSMRSAVKAAAKYGFALEEEWKWGGNLHKEPTPHVKRLGAKRKVAEYRRCDSIEQVKTAIANGRPVLFGFHYSQDFRDLDELVYRGSNKPTKGGHALVAIYYGKNGIGVENSWSDQWGWGGMAIIPWDIFKRDAFDMWVITEIGLTT